MEYQINILDMLSEERFHVRQIEYDETKPFLLHIHYARRMPSISYAYGIFEGLDLIGVCTYGVPASPSLCMGVGGTEWKDRVLELNRLAIIPEMREKNIASMLVGKSLKMLPKNIYVVSYADYGGWGHIGYVYQSTNWIYTGITRARTDIYSGEGKHSRHYDKNETRRQVRTAKHRYIYIVAESKKVRKEMINNLRYRQKPYPKGNTRRYDTDNPVSLIG